MTVPQYLARLAAEATTIINAEDYGRTIYDLAIRRELISIGEDVVNTAYDAPVDEPPREQIEEAERRLYELAETGRYDGGFQRFSEALTGAIDMAADGLQARRQALRHRHRPHRPRPHDGRPAALRPRHPRRPPGHGQDALATNIAFNIAKAYAASAQPDGSMKTVNGGIVGFFSLEMSAEQLATRIIAEQAGVALLQDPPRRHHARPSSTASPKPPARCRRIPLYIDQTGGISIAQLAARARRLKRQRGLDLLVVDYLQLLSGSSKKGENRVQELTEITTGLKALAKELKCRSSRLSQLSRQVENRDDKRPQLSDLRESGSIEQDADVVMFVYREEYYLKNKEPKPGTEEHFKWQAEMEQVARHGRGHHRQAAPRPDRHGRAAVRGRRHPLLRISRDEDKLPERMGD